MYESNNYHRNAVLSITTFVWFPLSQTLWDMHWEKEWKQPRKKQEEEDHMWNHKSKWLQNLEQVNESCTPIREPMGPICTASSQLHCWGVNLNVLFQPFKPPTKAIIFQCQKRMWKNGMEWTSRIVEKDTRITRLHATKACIKSTFVSAKKQFHYLPIL